MVIVGSEDAYSHKSNLSFALREGRWVLSDSLHGEALTYFLIYYINQPTLLAHNTNKHLQDSKLLKVNPISQT